MIQMVDIAAGEFKAEVSAGSYTCLATLPHFYAYYDDECQVIAGGRMEKTIAMSPMLNPGE